MLRAGPPCPYAAGCFLPGPGRPFPAGRFTRRPGRPFPAGCLLLTCPVVQSQHPVQGLIPDLKRLAGQPVHQINTDIVKSGLPGLPVLPLKLFKAVDPAQGSEKTVVRGLQSQTQAVDPRPSVTDQLIAGIRIRLCLSAGGISRRERPRIAFQRDLGVRGHPESGTDQVQCRNDQGRIRKRRRPAPEKDRDDLPAFRIFKAENLLPQTVKVLFLNLFFRRKGQEITVIAFSDAERNMNIDLKRHTGFHTRSSSLKKQKIRHRPNSAGSFQLPVCHSSSSFSTLMNAFCGISTEPTWRMRFLPSFCFSSSFFFRVMSPP